MPRPTVLLDCDGVLANFTLANLDFLRTIGIDRREDEVTTWNIEDALGLEPHQRARMKGRWSEPGFASALPVYDGAVEAVRILNHHADVIVVTSPMSSSRTWHGDRERWLREHFGIESRDVIHAAGERKARVHGDLLVEDKVETLVAWCNAHPHGYGILWHRPYNAKADILPRNATRCDSWRWLVGAVEAWRPMDTPRWVGQ